MREDQILTAGMDIDFPRPDTFRHDRAFDVPAGRPSHHGDGQEGSPSFRLPENKIPDLPSRLPRYLEIAEAGAKIVKRFLRKFSVLIKTARPEIHRSVLT